jgi:hypothetical protein
MIREDFHSAPPWRLQWWNGQRLVRCHFRDEAPLCGRKAAQDERRLKRAVISPALELTELLRAAVASVLSQAHQSFGGVVVDTGSVDDVATVASRSVESRRVMIHPVNRGGSMLGPRRLLFRPFIPKAVTTHHGRARSYPGFSGRFKAPTKPPVRLLPARRRGVCPKGCYLTIQRLVKP